MKRWSVVGPAGVVAVINGVSRVFTANQNTYLLHAMAQAGHGRLGLDWMAQTADLTPVFSMLVEAGYRRIGLPFLYLAQLAIACVLFGSLLVVVRRDLNTGELLLVAAGLAVIVTPFTRQFNLLGAMWGVAGQYVASTYLQPSDAGVFVVLAIAVYVSSVRHASLLAVAACGAAAVLHPTYIVPGALVTVVIAADEYHATRDPARLLIRLGLYALLSAPMALHLLLNLPLSDEAARVLVQFRIPHHARPDVWFGHDDLARIGLVALAAWLYRSDRIGVIVGVTGTMSLIASLAATALDHHRLLLMFPWRVSVVLIPISVTLLLAWLARHLSRVLAVPRLAWIAAAMAVCGLIALMVSSIQAFTRSMAAPELPASVPDGTYLIPPDEEDFRLESGQPVLVDAKTHPYRGDELLEWWTRLQAVRRFYESGECQALFGVLERWPDITHVLMPRTMPATCVGTRIGRVRSYDIYRVVSGQAVMPPSRGSSVHVPSPGHLHATPRGAYEDRDNIGQM